MKNIGTFSTFQDYLSSIQSAQVFNFRVGVFDNNRFSFHGSGNFFSDFFPHQPPVKPQTVVTPIGIMDHRSVRLDSTAIYEPCKDFLRQGDILTNNGQIPHVLSTPSYWMLSSHSCTMDHSEYTTILPIYTVQSLISDIGVVMTGKDMRFVKDIIGQNKAPRFIFLPPKDNIYDSAAVVDLGQIYTVKKDLLPSDSRVTSLTFSGLSYFQNRMAMYFFRDVDNWTDERQLR